MANWAAAPHGRASGARPTGPVAAVDLAGQLAVIREALAAGRRPPAGGLLGLPDLEGDVWVDIAGAAAVAGVGPRTITGWLSRGRPKASPFPGTAQVPLPAVLVPLPAEQTAPRGAPHLGR